MIGYAYAKTPAEARALPAALRAAGAERVWIDHGGRDERAMLFARGLDDEPVTMRRGDTVVLLSRSHLGVGREVVRFEGLAERLGVTICEVARDDPTPRKPGPAPAFPRTDEERRVGAHYWQGPYKRADAIRMIEERIGRPVTAAQLNRHIGPRGGPAE